MNGQASHSTLNAERDATAVADRQLGWVRHLPKAARDYAVLARLDRPIGSWLLLLPCWWGLALPTGGDAAAWGERAWYGALMALGAVVMRGAGCTLNDLADRDFDAKVERTRNRPLAAGRLSPFQAWAFLAFQLLLGLAVLLCLPFAAQAVAVFSLPLVAVYPFAKRFTWWPQLFLGLAFNWGVLVGSAAVTGTLGWSALLLYCAGIAWTLGYDTVYAHQDKEDDALIGVKSTARLLGNQTPVWLFGFYGSTLLLAAAAMVLADHSVYGFLALALPAYLLWRNAAGIRLDDPADCLNRFRANRAVGLAIVAALLLGQLG